MGVRNEFVYARYKMQMIARQHASVFVFILNRQAMMAMTENRPVLRGSSGMEAMGMTERVSYALFS